MFRRKSTKSSRPPNWVPGKSKKMLAREAKKLKKEEKESPVQLVSVRMTGGDEGSREVDMSRSNGVVEAPKRQPIEPDTTPTKPAPLFPVEGEDAAAPAAHHAALKSRSSLHIISGDSVTSTTSFDFTAEDLECDEETIKLSFQDDERVDEFEVVPTNHSSFQLLRNRLESNTSARINISYEL